MNRRSTWLNHPIFIGLSSFFLVSTVIFAAKGRFPQPVDTICIDCNSDSVTKDTVSLEGRIPSKDEPSSESSLPETLESKSSTSPSDTKMVSNISATQQIEDANTGGKKVMVATSMIASSETVFDKDSEVVIDTSNQSSTPDPSSLTQANLQGANLQGADLQGADLSGANLQGANLQGANLQGANLQETNLTQANLAGANLSEANLTDSNLAGVNLKKAHLLNAELVRAKFH